MAGNACFELGLRKLLFESDILIVGSIQQIMSG